MKRNVTGIMFYYYHVCERKLWLLSNKFNYEEESDGVLIEKMYELDEKEGYLIGKY